MLWLKWFPQMSINFLKRENMKHQFQNMVPMWWSERTESPWLSSDLYIHMVVPPGPPWIQVIIIIVKYFMQWVFCWKWVEWRPGHLQKAHSSLGELHYLMGWGPSFSLIWVPFLWKKRSWRFRERTEVLLCGSKNADWDVTDPAIQLHGDWSGRHLPQGADWAFLGLKLLCQINCICCLNNTRVLNFGKTQNGNSGWRG